MEIPRGLVAIALLWIAGLCPACSVCAPHSVRIGSEQVRYVVRGEGRPTVVLESDVGETYEAWLPVLDGIASVTTTLAYNRPGCTPTIPHRPASQGRHTADDVAASLHEILRSLHLPPPYVLVGHGAGGGYMIRFALRYPEEVAGIVLVDARVPGFRAACRAAGLDHPRPPGPWASPLSEHTREELRGLRGGTEAAVHDLEDVPVTVIAAWRPPPGASRKRQDLWIRMQGDLAAKAASGRLVVADESGHHVQRDDPELVIREITSLLEGVALSATWTDTP